MREFNKIFVVALPRCATVSMYEALGMLGVRIAHLGRIYGEPGVAHHDARRLVHMNEQIQRGDFNLDVLRECQGLADYPACCEAVFSRLDHQYPGSLFINIQRSSGRQRWIQSVERQFIGLQLAKQSRQATDEERQFMQAMLNLREMTFGQSQFDAAVYLRAYEQHQRAVASYFSERPGELLNIEDTAELAEHGFERLCRFLNYPPVDLEFPNVDSHSEVPRRVFMEALKQGEIVSQTGIQPPSETSAG